jgi:hypothetical protein
MSDCYNKIELKLVDLLKKMKFLGSDGNAHH